CVELAGAGTGIVSFCFANSSVVAPLLNAIIFPSGDHCWPPAPRGNEVNCHASPPCIDIMNNCGASGRPSFSGTRTKQMYWPSGDQRGEVSLGPAVSWRDSPLAVDTVQIAVSYPSFFAFTVTRTNAIRDPSGVTCGSAIHTKLNKSFSVMFRFCPKTGVTRIVIETMTSKRRDRIGFLSDKQIGLGFEISYSHLALDSVGKSAVGTKYL